MSWNIGTMIGTMTLVFFSVKTRVIKLPIWGGTQIMHKYGAILRDYKPYHPCEVYLHTFAQSHGLSG